jgi:predicted NBD/HSP70 family sugar kinase
MFVAIDIGKTNTRVASTKDLKAVYKLEKFATSPDLVEQKAKIKEAFRKVVESEQVKYCCIGMPGILDKISQTFFKITLWPELDGLPYAAFLKGCIEGPDVYFENDAALAGLGEAVRGSGKEFGIIAYVTISTGVGGMRIPVKELDQSFYFSEPGHMIIDKDGPVDETCGQKGCLQALISGPAFENLYHVKPEDCNDEKLWDEYSDHLSIAVTNLIAMWAPEAVIIGGGLSQKFDFMYPKLLENLQTQKFFPVPEIRKSAFEDESGIQGGFTYISRIIS